MRELSLVFSALFIMKPTSAITLKMYLIAVVGMVLFQSLKLWTNLANVATIVVVETQKNLDVAGAVLLQSLILQINAATIAVESLLEC